jgi:hypothetical protein
VDRGITAKLEGPTDSHSLALVGGSKGKTNTNPSTRKFFLSSLMSMPDEEFDVLGEDELALLTRRFERLHENRVNMRRNTRTCFQCGKPGHFVSDYPEKVENKDGYKHKSKDKRWKSKKKDHGHGKKMRSQEKMKRSSDIESDSEDTSSSSSDEDEEDDKKKRKKNLGKYLNGLCVMGLSLKDDFCGMARSSSSKRSQKDTSNLDSEDEVCDELFFAQGE